MARTQEELEALIATLDAQIIRGATKVKQNDREVQYDVDAWVKSRAALLDELYALTHGGAQVPRKILTTVTRGY
jgi:hypothetical protein